MAKKEPDAICSDPERRHSCKQALYHWFCIKKGYCKFKLAAKGIMAHTSCFSHLHDICLRERNGDSEKTEGGADDSV